MENENILRPEEPEFIAPPQQPKDLPPQAFDVPVDGEGLEMTQQIDIAEDGEAVGKLIDAGDLSRVEYALVQ